MDTFNGIKEIFVELYTTGESEKYVNPEKVTFDSKLSEDLGLDSLDLMELVLEVEKKYKIVIEDDEAFCIETIQDLIDLINKKTAL